MPRTMCRVVAEWPGPGLAVLSKQVASKPPDASVLVAGGAEPTACARKLERLNPHIGDGDLGGPAPLTLSDRGLRGACRNG